MASRIKLKRSTTPNSAPTTSDLTDKEVALNIIDRTLYVNNGGNITEVANADPNDEKIVPSMFSSSITDGIGNTWYVSTNGTDKATLGSVNPRHGETTGANQWGATPMTAFASLKYCLDNYAQSGDLIVIAAGQYEEVFPLTVPDGVVIKGAGLKSTFIRPSVSTNSEDAFLIEGNCNIEDLCVNDFYYDNVNDTGYAFRLASNYTVAVDGRRPYIQRCSVITKGSTVTQADPRGYASGDAGRGALVDGADAATTSSEASLLFNECTFVVPNSVGLYLKNGARCEWLNCFTYFAADSIKAENPGGSGFAGQGRTRLKLNTVNGTFNAGNTISYYDTDGTTVLASGTIDENDGTYIYVDGQGTGRFAEAAETVEGKAVTVNGDAQLDTTNKQFGASSLLLDGTGDYLSLASSSDFGFGTGDFAIEMWVRPSSISGNRIIYDSRISASTEVKPTLYLNSGILTYYVNGAARITGATLSINTWYHIVVSRSGTSTKLFVNGTQSGSTYTDTNDYGTNAPVLIGSNIFFASNWSGYIDEVRVSKGVARYTTNFTSPTTEYFADTNTSLLLHFNGIDGSTDIFDGGISSQDIRSSSGGTAQYITLADYTDFGAELRSIGSASVYGQRGVTADGKGVRLRCILHNFGYVGVGADQSNDISNVNQANEIIEINGGRALFTSMDQNGDFRVGNAFFVDQEKGTVSFAGGSSGAGTTFDQLIVTGTGNTTTILPTSITVGNLQLSNNDIISSTNLLQTSPLNIGNLQFGVTGNNIIDTTTGNLFLSSSSGTTTVDDNLVVTGTTTLQGNLVTNQSITVASSNVTNLTASNADIDNLDVIDNANVYKDFTTYSTEFSGFISGTVDYAVGSYTSISLTGGSGQGAIADFDVIGGGISSGTFTAGSGYPPSTYTNIAGTEGTGTGAVATITVGINQNVSSVTITSSGSGYTNGDVIEFDLGNGTPVIEYTVTGTSNSIDPSSFIITNFGTSAYSVGDNLSASDSDIGGGPYFSTLQYTITSLSPHVFIDASEKTILGDGTLEIKGSTWLASTDPDGYVAIGFTSNTNLGDPEIDGDNEKLEVNGNIRTQGDVKALGNIVASFGSVTQPSIKFDSDPTSSSLWNRTGFFAEYGQGHGKINVVGDQGRIVRYSADRTDFYKTSNYVTYSFGDPVIQNGSNYTEGIYNSVAVIGGSGTGASLNLTIAFDGSITDPGSGYTDSPYENIPLIYAVPPGGAITSTTNLIGGSDYVNGTYTNVPLTNGTGLYATADITVSSGSVTNVSIVNGGTGYTINDPLSVDTQYIGGSKLSTVNISNAGSNYRDGTYELATLTNISGDGVNAKATVVISNGSVSSVTITENGSGYTLLDQLSLDTASFDSNGSYTFNVEDSTSPNDYTFTGDATGSDPTITVNENDDLTFNVNVPGNGLTNNAFAIVSQLSLSGGYDAIYDVPTVVNNGAVSGTITWTPTTAGTYYYVSKTNNNYLGTIQVLSTNVGSGSVLSVSNLITGSGFSVDVSGTGSSTGGTGALANITITQGAVESIVVTNGGSGYSVFDQLTVDYNDLIYVDPLGTTIQSVEPTTDLRFSIQNLGVVTQTTLDDDGIGYEEGDILTLPTSFRPPAVSTWNSETEYSAGSYVSYNYNLYEVTSSGISDSANPPTHTTGSVLNGTAIFTFYGQEYYYEFGPSTLDNSVIINPTDGKIESKSIDVTTAFGITIDSSLLITNNTISKNTLGNLILSAQDYVQIDGTDAVIIPAGTTQQRPSLTAGDAGAIRYNTSESRFEGFNGQFFVSLGGVRDVDGNTYISAELNPGDDDNILRFVNNGVQSMQVEQTKLTFQSVTDIITTNVSGITEWEAGAAATAPADPVNDPPVFVYYEYNVYSVTSSGTFDATTPPTHTTGTVTNGTVDLLWVRFAYGELTFNNTDSNVAFLLDNLIVNNNAVRISGTSSTFGKIGTNSDGLILNFTSQETEFIKFGSTGTLEVNVNYDLGTQNYIQVLDKDLRKFDLRDTRTGSGVTSLNTSSGNSTTVSLFPYTESYSGKVMVEITDDSTTPRKQYSEISYLVKSDGSDILYTESNKIYTDVVLCNVEADLDGGNVSILITDVTGSTTLTYSIKVVSNTILA